MSTLVHTGSKTSNNLNDILVGRYYGSCGERQGKAPLFRFPHQLFSFSKRGQSAFSHSGEYFIMVQNLLDDRTVDYEKYIRQIDPMVPKSFLRSIISKITVDDGKVSSIEFKNGIIHTFSYKQA